MVYHIGIILSLGEVAAYNVESKEIFNFKIGSCGFDDNQRVASIFKKIKSQINGSEIGCVCIYLSWNFDNETRRILIATANQNGCEKVEIIDWYTLHYLNCISESKFKPNNGDIIWCLFSKCCFIWEKTNTKAKLIKTFPFFSSISNENNYLKVKKETGIKKDPNLIIYDETFFVKLNIVEKLIPNCKIFIWRSPLWTKFDEAGTALMKARIMDEDSEFLDYDACTNLEKNVSIKINGKKLITFGSFQPLPLKKEAIINIKNLCDSIEIVAEDDYDRKLFQEKITQPNEIMKGTLVTLKIDKNRIFSINYLNSSST